MRKKDDFSSFSFIREIRVYPWPVFWVSDFEFGFFSGAEALRTTDDSFTQTRGRFDSRGTAPRR
jgi:hypothetical protein